MIKVSIKKLREILRLKFELKLSHRLIGKMVHASASTVSRYYNLFQDLTMEPEQLEKMSDNEIYGILVKQSKDLSLKKDFIEPDFKHIHQELKLKTVTLQLLWEDIVIFIRRELMEEHNFVKCIRLGVINLR